MADDKYPMIPLSAWWELRNKFKQKIPSSVTADYVAAVLGMKKDSAKWNVLPSLVRFRIIDPDGKPLDRARNWRDDEQYPELCKQIREEIYPTELLDAVPGPVVDRLAATNWLLLRTGLGDVSAKKIVAVYEMLWEADPSKGQETANKPPSNKPKKQIAPKLPIVPVPVGGVTNQPTIEEPAVSPAIKTKPSLSYEPIHLNFNIQIVLPENASEETYNNIFKSIATYLLGRGEE